MPSPALREDLWTIDDASLATLTARLAAAEAAGCVLAIVALSRGGPEMRSA